ncbi:MAG: transposase [Rhabdochlamydiaceae bacterium]
MRNISIAELCRKHNVTPNAFYGWKEKFLEAGKLALSSSGSPKNNHENAGLQNENERLKKLIGELTIANGCFTHVRLGMTMFYAFFEDSNLGAKLCPPIFEE